MVKVLYTFIKRLALLKQGLNIFVDIYITLVNIYITMVNIYITISKERTLEIS